jgi:eukaryotic-like serine/threonine-protein kinase
MRNGLTAALNSDSMPGAAAGATGVEDRMYERLAEALEARERSATRSVDTTILFQRDPEVASQLTAYFETADLVERYASGLNPMRADLLVLPMPARIGVYELVREIGRGGTAVVYEARQAGLNRTVAIKMLTRGRSGSMFNVERLRFEAEAVAHLAHPGIVPVYEVGEHDGCPWFSMQLYEQGSLTRSLGEFAEQPRRAAEMLETIAHAVHHAHQRGILHRDLKPSNILLDAAGRPSVADFGLAKRMGEDQDLTQPGELIGTPAYMAPERVGGSTFSGPATTATDIYGLGAILYALLTGRPPFEAATPVETLLAVGTTDVVRPSVVNPRVESDLETICLKALEKNPAHRYASAAELAQDLRRWLDGDPILARPIHGIERLRRWTRRHPVQATAALSALLLTLVGAVGLTTGYVVVSRAYRTAEMHRQTAETHAAALTRRFYVSQMSLAHRYAERGELSNVRTVLDEFRNQPEQQGFEWHWFDRLTRTMPPETVRFSVHKNRLYSGAFSPDGQSVATCGADGHIRIWDTATGTQQQVFSNGSGMSEAERTRDENYVKFTPDGQRLVSCGEDGGVRLWSLADGAQRDLSGPGKREVLSLDVSADGTQAAAGWVDGSVNIWNLETGELREALPPVAGEIEEVRFVGGTDCLLVIDLSGHVVIYKLPGGDDPQVLKVEDRARAAAVSPDGTQFAAGGAAGVVEIFEIATERRVIKLYFGSEVRSLDFSPDGTRVAATGNDGCVKVWSLADGRLLSFFKAHPTTCWQVSFSPDGNRLLTVSSDTVARVWDLAAQAERPDIGVSTRSVRQITYSPDDRRVLLVTADGEAELWDRTAPYDPVVLPMKVCPDSRPQFINDGSQLVFLDKETEAIHGWDCNASSPLNLNATVPDEVRHKRAARRQASLGMLSDGRLAVMTRKGSLIVHSEGVWRSVARPDDDTNLARIIGTTADGSKLLVMRDAPDRMEFWQVENDKIRITLVVPGFPQCVAASRDGRSIAVGRQDGTIELIDPESGANQGSLMGHDAHVLSVDFSPDGRTLASASEDGTARLWSLAEQTEVSVVDRREKQVWMVAFSPSGTELAIGGERRIDRASVQFLRAE